MNAEEIYKQYSKKIMGYIRSKITSPTVAEDLHSDVFLKICSKIDSFDRTKASVSTWVYTITKNTVVDYFRTHREHDEIDENVPFRLSGGGDGGDLSAGIIKAEELEELAKALERLPERERDIIVLHYYSGVPLETVAEKIGCAYSTVRAAHNNALAKLKKYLS